MRRAGRVVAEMHSVIRQALRPGVNTAHLNALAAEVIERRGAVSNFLGYGDPPFPGVICASPNFVVVHGIPGSYVLEEGDIISIDCGASVEGYHGDAAFTAGIGTISPEANRLISTTEQALGEGIKQLVQGGRLNEVGRAVEQFVQTRGMAVVRDYVGHGIGLAMHEAPDVPNFWPGKPGPKLESGMVFAIEPMVNLGTAETREQDDGWTVVSSDGSLSAHFEHTVAVGNNGPEVLTAL